MNAELINKICFEFDDTIAEYYRGTFNFANFLENGINFCDFQTLNIFIVNTQTGPPGKHWILFLFNPKFNQLCYFDSFAKPLEFYGKNLQSLLDSISIDFELPIRTSSYRIQGNSAICGLYCIYVAHFLASGNRLDHIIAKFSSTKLDENDENLIEWFENQPYSEIIQANCADKTDCITYDQLNGITGRN